MSYPYDDLENDGSEISIGPFNRDDDDDNKDRDCYPPILTVRDVRELFSIGKNKVYEMLNSGEIKGFRIGRDWRIEKETLMKYIGDHYQVM